MDAQISSNDDYFPGKISACFSETGNVAVSHKYLGEILETIVHSFRVESAKRKAEIDALKARIVELEARGWPEYHGVWQAGKTYQKNAAVTHADWIALKTTAAYPGGAESGWQPSAKKGRDGKDGKDAK